MARSATANDFFAFSSTWTWLRPAIWNSTGSSTVVMLSVTSMTFWSAE